MNPRRLLAVLAIAAAAILLIVRLVDADSRPGAATTSSTIAAPPAAAATSPDDPGNRPAPTSSSPDVDAGARLGRPTSFDVAGATAAAVGFAQAWTRHTRADADGWATRLAARSTPELASKLQTVDPATVPASTVIGAPQLTATPAGADASITTDTGTLRLGLIRRGRWQVDTVDWTPAR